MTTDSEAQPLRILLVCDALSAAGTGRHVAALATGLVATGHRVTVACIRDGAMLQSLVDAGVHIQQADGGGTRRSAGRYVEHLQRVIAAEEPDVVHAHMRSSVIAAAHAVGEREIFVITEHGDPPWGDAGVRRDLLTAYGRADAVITVSQRVAERVAAAGVERSRIRVVPDAIRAAEAPALLPAAGREGSLVGIVAPLDAASGVDVFLRAAARAAREVRAARFVVVGDGPKRPSLERLAERLGIRERVGFLAQRDDLVPVLLRLNVLCAPTPEALDSAATREATALGVPIVDATEARALQSRMVKLLRRRRFARRLAQAARQRALHEFSPERMVEAVSDVYRDVAAPRVIDVPAVPLPEVATVAAPA